MWVRRGLRGQRGLRRVRWIGIRGAGPGGRRLCILRQMSCPVHTKLVENLINDTEAQTYVTSGEENGEV